MTERAMSPLTSRGKPRKRAYARVRARNGMTIAERIALHVAVDRNGCWIWGLQLDGGGYARVTVGGTPGLYVHRLSYEEHVGPIPEGLQLDHLCRNRACVNPEHLEPVTPLTNTRRSPIHNGARTHCPSNHPYDEANTYRWGGRRYCRACKTAAARASEKRAAA